MKVFSALFAEVLVRTHGLVHDPDTTAVLPDLARVTLDEHAADIIGQHVRVVIRRVPAGLVLGARISPAATESVSPGRRQARVVLLPAETPGDFFLFPVLFLVLLAGRLEDVVILVVVPGALALARLWEVVLGAVVRIVEGLRTLRRRPLRGRDLVVRASIPLPPREGAGEAGRVCVLEQGRRGLACAGTRGTTRRHGGKAGCSR